MTVKVIIFDFDGTIADTLDAITSITNRLAKDFGYKIVSQEELIRLKNLDSRQIIKQAGISPWQIPFIMRRIKIELKKEIQLLKPIPEIKATLTKLIDSGCRLGIITSNSRENVTFFLKNNDMQELFDFIYSGPTLFGKNKVIARVIRAEKLNPKEVIYVGDETRDIEASRKTRIKSVAVSWGFNSRSVLAAYKPDFLIQHPSELIEVLKSFSPLPSN